MPNLNTTDILNFNAKEFLSKRVIICQNYNYKKIKKIEFPEALSFTSKKIIIKDENNKMIFLKVKPAYCSDEASLEKSAYLQNFLAERLHFIPPIIKTIDRLDYLKINNEIFFVTKYIPGDYFNGSDCDVKAAGAALGKMHKISKKIKKEFKQKLSIEISSFFMDLAIDHLKKNNFLSSYQNDVSLLTSFLNKAETRLNKLSKRYFLLAHGDYNPFNLIYDFNKRSVIAINDFDNVEYLPRIHDLAEGLLTFCYIHYKGNSSSYQDFLGSYCPTKANIFLNSYLQYVKLSQVEIGLLNLFVKIIWIELICLGIIRDDYSFDKLTMFSFFCNEFDDFYKKYVRSNSNFSKI